MKNREEVAARASRSQTRATLREGGRGCSCQWGWWPCQTSANSPFFFYFFFFFFSLSFFLCLFSFIPLACTTITISLKSSILFFLSLFYNLFIFSGLFCPTLFCVFFDKPSLISATPIFFKDTCVPFILQKSHALWLIRLPVAF